MQAMRPGVHAAECGRQESDDWVQETRVLVVVRLRYSNRASWGLAYCRDEPPLVPPLWPGSRTLIPDSARAALPVRHILESGMNSNTNQSRSKTPANSNGPQPKPNYHESLIQEILRARPSAGSD